MTRSADWFWAILGALIIIAIVAFAAYTLIAPSTAPVCTELIAFLPNPLSTRALPPAIGHLLDRGIVNEAQLARSLQAQREINVYWAWHPIRDRLEYLIEFEHAHYFMEFVCFQDIGDVPVPVFGEVEVIEQ